MINTQSYKQLIRYKTIKCILSLEMPRFFVIFISIFKSLADIFEPPS